MVSPLIASVLKTVALRWLMGVVVVGGALPIGLIYLFLVGDPHFDVTYESVVGRGELFLVSGAALLTTILDGLGSQKGKRISAEVVLVLVVVFILPCFAVWAKGVSDGVIAPQSSSLDPGIATGVGTATLIIGYVTSLLLAVWIALDSGDTTAATKT